MNERKRLYAEARLSGNNQTQAAITAGASKRSAHDTGSKLERDPEVRAYIEAEQKRRQEKHQITTDELIASVLEIRKKAMEGPEPDLRLALRANQSLGDFIGSFDKKNPGKDLTKITVTVEDYTSDE